MQQMMTKVKRKSAWVLLGLFILQILLSAAFCFSYVQNRKQQRAKMLSHKTHFRVLRLSKKDYEASVLPDENEMLWHDTLYDLKDVKVIDGICQVTVIADQKETNSLKVAEKSAGKPVQKNAASHLLLKCLPEEEITYAFRHVTDLVRYIPIDMEKYFNPFYRKSVQPPDEFC
jgi:hypothetical protein